MPCPINRRFEWWLVTLTVIAFGCTPARGAESPSKPVVLTTSMVLECAVNDVAGNLVVCRSLVPAGSCPGHFDLEPADVENVRKCLAFLRHDFQSALDSRLLGAGVATDRLVPVSVKGSLGVPSNYETLCRQVAAEIGRRLGKEADGFRAALDEIHLRVERMSHDTQSRLATRKGLRVVTSQHAAGFCGWAGLEVIATYAVGEDLSAAGVQATLSQARKHGPQAVIGQVQAGGERAMKAWAEALGVPAVLVSNFPKDGRAGAFWRLMEDNLKALEHLPASPRP